MHACLLARLHARALRAAHRNVTPRACKQLSDWRKTSHHALCNKFASEYFLCASFGRLRNVSFDVHDAPCEGQCLVLEIATQRLNLCEVEEGPNGTRVVGPTLTLAQHIA